MNREPKVELEKLLAVSRGTRPVGLPGGGLAFASNQAGHAQVYVVGGPGELAERLVETDDRVVPQAWTEDGLVVRHDHGGDEVWQLSLLDEQRRLVALTHDAAAIHTSPVIRPDGRAFGLSWNPAGQADTVVGELLLPDGGLRIWLQPSGFWTWHAWRPDGEQAVVAQAFGTWNEAYLLDRSGDLTRLLPGSRMVSGCTWTRAGLYLLTDGGDDFIGLAEVDPARPAEVKRWVHHPDRDVIAAVASSDGSRLAVVENTGIYDRLFVLDLDTGARREKTDLPKGVVISDHTGQPEHHLGWSPDGGALFVAWETPTRPSDILAFPGGERWTRVNEGELPGLVKPRETGYSSFDGLEIPCLQYRVDGSPRPTVCIFHGGPESQSRGEYRPLYHLLNAMGMDVLAPNVRGSAGYGFRFQSLDDRTLRWDSVLDGCAAARWLKSTGQATKVAAAGGSYGGFLTLAVIVAEPDLWDAAVDTVGIARWRTFFERMPPWRGVLRQREYGDPFGAEAEFLESISPIHRAASIRAPLLVVHGRNDPRVPVAESIQIAEAAGAELLIFENEGHGIARHENQIVYHRRILEFLQENLA